MARANHGRSLGLLFHPLCRAIACLAAATAIACGQGDPETAASSEAITYGELDAGRHPNVGALMLLFEDGVYRPSCSGVLIAPRVFLTAGHCVAWFWDWAEHGTYGVSFLDNVRPAAAPGLVPAFGTAILHPDYVFRGGNSADNDYAVILLDEPAEPTPATLPEVGELDELAARAGLVDQAFAVVGYGVTETFTGVGIRRLATGKFRSLTPTHLFLSQNPSTGDGGGCNGDSGGPNFLGDDGKVVALTSTGDRVCRSLNAAVRLDLPAVQSFLAEFLDERG